MWVPDQGGGTWRMCPSDQLPTSPSGSVGLWRWRLHYNCQQQSYHTPERPCRSPVRVEKQQNITRIQKVRNSVLAHPMLSLVLSKDQGCKDFWKPSKFQPNIRVNWIVKLFLWGVGQQELTFPMLRQLLSKTQRFLRNHLNLVMLVFIG